jgi:hypothetical protein
MPEIGISKMYKCLQNASELALLTVRKTYLVSTFFEKIASSSAKALAKKSVRLKVP